MVCPFLSPSFNVAQFLKVHSHGASDTIHDLKNERAFYRSSQPTRVTNTVIRPCSDARKIFSLFYLSRYRTLCNNLIVGTGIG